MSAIGPKRTSLVAPHMSAFGGKADMTVCGCLLFRSLLGVKRTWAIALHMSAFDPKRTSTSPACLFARRSGSEDDRAEASESESKVDAANHRHRCEQGPDDRKIGAPIQDRLRKGYEMRRRARDLHHVLQPDRHALHRGRTARQKLHDEKDGCRQQRELAHCGRDRAQQDAERGNRESVKRGSGKKER